MDDQPEATVRAGHTGHGRVLFEGDLLDCLAVNRHHVGASRVWIGCVAMTMPKMPLSRAVDMADNVLAQAAYVAAQLAEGAGPLMSVVADRARADARRSPRTRRPVPRHAHQDPAGSEWLAKVGAVS